jgi:hypothetical protein
VRWGRSQIIHEENQTYDFSMIFNVFVISYSEILAARNPNLETSWKRGGSVGGKLLLPHKASASSSIESIGAFIGLN